MLAKLGAACGSSARRSAPWSSCAGGGQPHRDRQALAEQGVIHDGIAESRVRIEQARLLVLKTAWLMDTVGNKGAHTEIQAIKIVIPVMAQWVIDRAIQAHGGGVSQDFPLAHLWASGRTLRFAGARTRCTSGPWPAARSARPRVQGLKN